MTKFGTLVLLAAFGFSAAGAVQAQGVNLDVGTDINVSATSSGLDAGVMADTDASLSSDAGTSTEVGSATLAEFSIDRNDLTEGTVYSVTRAEDVMTPASLESYVGSLVERDDRVEEIELANGELVIRYKAEAKFLGFIPGSITIRAEVSPEGEVRVSYPWYSFLMAKAESRADLEARLNHDLDVIADDLTEDIEIGSGANVQTVPMNDSRRMALIVERLRSSLYAQGSAEART